MAGRGWLPDEHLNWNKGASTRITAKSADGAPATISVESTIGFFPGQLVCLGDRTRGYQSAVIDTIVGQDIRLTQPPRLELAPGAQLYSFLSNDAHPTEFGYYALADDALRQLDDRPLPLFNAYGPAGWKKLGTVKFSEDWDSDYGNPGTTSVEACALQFEAEQSGDGIVFDAVDLARGSYRLTLPLSVKGATERGVHLQLIASRGNKTLGRESFMTFDGAAQPQLDFDVGIPGGIHISLHLAMAGRCSISVGKLEVKRKYACRFEPRKGRHLLFGDSWINAGYITKRFRERLPNTEFIQSGVGGNTFKDLLERFERDVSAQSPDYVWVMCGTNDVYQMWEPTYFQSLIVELRDKIRAIGAQPIFWNASVCNRTYRYGDRLAPSRRFAIEVDYGVARST